MAKDWKQHKYSVNKLEAIWGLLLRSTCKIQDKAHTMICIYEVNAYGGVALEK